jgi:2-oxoglutarate ferredoxin oxidoreductase subunit alpha
MSIGAGWAGLRSMTSTSGPGVSLMTEFIGLAYYSEVPVVVWNVQRVGPSTGLPTRTSQGDLTMTYFLGHGDTHQVILLPSSPKECFEFGWRAFDIAERLQTPVFVLSDLDMGMNQWMTEKFEYPNQDFDRGKVLWEDDMEKLTERWGRYLDVDGDGIPYRTIPGNRHPKSAYFARGTGHDEYAKYTEDSEAWEKNMERLIRKFETAWQYLPESDIREKKGSKLGFITFGSAEPAVSEAVDRLEDEGIKIDFLRLRALPLREEIGKYIEARERVYVVELNRDGQLWQLLTLEYPGLACNLVSIPKHDGLPLSATWVVDTVLEKERE